MSTVTGPAGSAAEPVGSARELIQSRSAAAREIIAATARAPRIRRDVRHLERYCMFIGYPRSGHSLVGALLDAHPDAVIAHELDALRYASTGVVGRLALFALIVEQERRFQRSGVEWSGYRYAVAGQWQGRFRRLRVIGDKKGGRSTARLGNDPGLLDRLQRIVRIPVRMVHVIRDPFDTIATMHRRGEGSLEACAERYFELVDVNQAVRRRVGQGVLDLHHIDLVRDPRRELERLCAHVSIDPDRSYVDACASIVSSSPHRSRHEVRWPRALRHDIEVRIGDVDFLAGYTFDD